MMALSQGKGNQTDKAPRQGQRPQADRGPLTCFKCGGIGHKAAECRANNVPTPAQHYARANYMESSYEEPTYEVPASCNAPCTILVADMLTQLSLRCMLLVTECHCNALPGT